LKKKKVRITRESATAEEGSLFAATGVDWP